MARSGRPPKIDPLKPIHRAVMDGGVSTFSVALAAGDDLNTPGPEGMTPLHIAAHRGNVQFARALLDAGADIDPINVWGNTPLWRAIVGEDQGSVSCVASTRQQGGVPLDPGNRSCQKRSARGSETCATTERGAEYREAIP